jgi:hypothetical protein
VGVFGKLMGSARRRVVVPLAVVVGCGVLAGGAQATTFTVTGTGDDAAGGSCAATSCTTLRDALSQANADLTNDTIAFAANVSGQITLTHGVLPVSGVAGVSILGPGAGRLAIAGNSSQVFDVGSPPDSTVTISGLTIKNGAGASNPGGAIQHERGAALSEGTLVLSGDMITESTTSAAAGGGGVYSNGGPLTIEATTISGNSAPRGGGVSAASGLTVGAGSVISGNTANSSSAGGGGGVYSSGSISVGAATISANNAVEEGGGVALNMSAGQASFDGATISGNGAPLGGGVWERLEGALVGGDMEHTTVSGNHGTEGAGLFIATLVGGELRVGTSTIAANSASSYGGGIMVQGNIYDDLRIAESTITGNTAGVGGGISFGRQEGMTPPLETTAGGQTGSIAIDNSTIAGNLAAQTAGGIYLSAYEVPPNRVSGTAALESTIVAGNVAAGAPSDLARPADSTGGGFPSAFSLIQAPGNAPLLSPISTIVGQDPALGPLAFNGGPTETMLPASTSVVIDRGRAGSAQETDQRGDPRIVDTALANAPGGDGTDIGAAELPASAVAIPAVPVAPAPPGTGGHAHLCHVPKLTGKKLKVVRKKVGRADCKLGKVIKRKGVTAKGGKVVKQSPKPGKSLPAHSKVRVTLGP